MGLNVRPGIGQQRPSLPKYETRHLTPPGGVGLNGRDGVVNVVLASVYYVSSDDEEVYIANLDPSRVGAGWTLARGKQSFHVNLRHGAGSMVEYRKRSQGAATVSGVELA